MLRFHVTLLAALAGFPAPSFQSAPKPFDPASIAPRLDKARREYEKAVDGIRAALLVSLDEHEEAARQAADAKTRDRVLAERVSLRTHGEWPGCIEDVALAKQYLESRKAYDDAFSALIGECIKNRLDGREALLTERRAAFQRTSDLAPWLDLEVNAGDGASATAWKHESQFISPEFGGSPELKNMLRFDGLSALEYLLELRVQRTAGSGGLMVGLRGSGVDMVEFRVAAADDDSIAPIVGARRTPLRLLVSVQRGRLAVEAEGASYPVWNSGEKSLECPKHLEGLPAALYLRCEDSSTHFRVDPPRAKPLGDYAEPPLPEEPPPAAAPVPREVLLPEGSAWSGTRTSGNDKFSCEMHVESRHDNEVVFTLDEGTFVTKWRGELNDTRLKITGITVLKKGGFTQREWSRPWGVGQLAGDKLTVKWKWHWEGPQKSVNENGEIALTRKQ